MLSSLLFFVSPQSELVTVWDITPTVFDKLVREHDKSLSCPCSSSLITYNEFVSNNLTIDPICSSIFVNEEWIESLYIPSASSFLVMDFRTTAYSQVRGNFIIL